MTLFTQFSLSRSRFGPSRQHLPNSSPARSRALQSAPTLSRDELLREVIAIIG